MAAPPPPPGIDELRKRARGLENKIETLLVSFSNLASSSSLHAASAAASVTAADGLDAVDQQQRELSALLEQLAEANESMARHAGGPVASVHTLQRHREILHDYTQEFAKTKASVQSARERAQLLSSVRADVRELRAAEAGGAGAAAARADSANLLRERNAIHHAVRLADEVIGRAQATQGSLDEQRALFGRIRRTVLDVGARLPAVGALVGAIHTRRRRDVLVVGGTATVCTILLLWSIMH